MRKQNRKPLITTVNNILQSTFNTLYGCKILNQKKHQNDEDSHDIKETKNNQGSDLI